MTHESLERHVSDHLRVTRLRDRVVACAAPAHGMGVASGAPEVL
jgi:hypothetical protein